MAIDSQQQGQRNAMLTRGHPHRLKLHQGRFAMGLALASLTGLLGVAELADRAADPTAARPLALTAFSNLGLLGMVALAAGGAIVCAKSPDRNVFHARRISACGLFLAAVGILLAIVMARRGPFDHLVTTFRIGAPDVADFGLLLAAMICLIASGAALFDASEARRKERSWSDHLSHH